MKPTLKKLNLLIASALLVFGSLPAYAQTDALQSARQDVAQSVGNLTDAEGRKNALLKVLDLAGIEMTELQSKLQALKDLDPTSLKLKEYFSGLLDDYLTYYQTIEDQLNADLSDKQVQQIASDFSSWWDTEYQSTSKKILDLLLTVKSKQSLQIANARLEKISGDLSNLKTLPASTLKSLQSLFDKAGDNLQNAQQIIEQAGNLLTNYLPVISSSSPDVLLFNASTTTSGESTTSQIATTSVSTNSFASTTNQLPPKNDIRSYLASALGQIKLAYKKFLDMSTLIKNSLPSVK